MSGRGQGCRDPGGPTGGEVEALALPRRMLGTVSTQWEVLRLEATGKSLAGVPRATCGRAPRVQALSRDFQSSALFQRKTALCGKAGQRPGGLPVP